MASSIVLNLQGVGAGPGLDWAGLSWARLAGTVHNQIIIIASHFKCQETGTVTARAKRYTTAVAWEDEVKAEEGWSKRKRKSQPDCQACHNSRARVNAPRDCVAIRAKKRSVFVSLSLFLSLYLCVFVSFAFVWH